MGIFTPNLVAFIIYAIFQSDNLLYIKASPRIYICVTQPISDCKAEDE